MKPKTETVLLGKYFSPTGIIFIAVYGMFFFFFMSSMSGCFEDPGCGLCQLGAVIPFIPPLILSSILTFPIKLILPFDMHSDTIMVGSLVLWAIFLYLLGLIIEKGFIIKNVTKKYLVLIPSFIVVVAIGVFIFFVGSII